MASAKKPNARRRPPPAGQEGVPDAPSPAIVNGATAPLRVVPPPTVPDPEVRERAVRRRFTAEYKLQVLREADRCAGLGEIGALLRREGLYSSLLVVWRRARGRGELAALTPRKRGRTPTPVDPRDRKITELERQLAAMTGRAERAEVLVDAQKNLAALLGRPGATARS